MTTNANNKTPTPPKTPVFNWHSTAFDDKIIWPDMSKFVAHYNQQYPETVIPENVFLEQGLTTLQPFVCYSLKRSELVMAPFNLTWLQAAHFYDLFATTVHHYREAAFNRDTGDLADGS